MSKQASGSGARGGNVVAIHAGAEVGQAEVPAQAEAPAPAAETAARVPAAGPPTAGPPTAGPPPGPVPAPPFQFGAPQVLPGLEEAARAAQARAPLPPPSARTPLGELAPWVLGGAFLGNVAMGGVPGILLGALGGDWLRKKLTGR